jgi:hypothetical protein
VLGLILGDFTRTAHPLLSSKTIEFVIVCDISSLVTAASARNRFLSHMSWDTKMFSASVVDKAISVCSFDAQSTGHPQKVRLDI